MTALGPGSKKHMSEELVELFKARNYKWTLQDGSKIIPSVEDMARTLAAIDEKIETEPDGTVLSVGRLLANKQPDGLEIYIYIGDYNG